MEFLAKRDLQGINNEDKYDFSRFRYLERIRKIIGEAERYCSGKKILEVGYAESNTSLFMAEEGFLR